MVYGLLCLSVLPEEVVSFLCTSLTFFQNQLARQTIINGVVETAPCTHLPAQIASTPFWPKLTKGGRSSLFHGRSLANALRSSFRLFRLFPSHHRDESLPLFVDEAPT